MSNRWNNDVAEFLLPKQFVITFGLCLILLLAVAGYVKMRDISDTTRINKEIEEAQKHIDQGEYAAAFDVLSKAFQDNYGKVLDQNAVEPLSEKGDQLLKTATSGIFSGYGLPYEGKYEIKDPVCLYLYIPQPGEELYKEGCYYFAWSKEELLSRAEIFELFARPESVMEYKNIEYKNGLGARSDPSIRIENCGGNESGLNPYGAVTFTYDYATGCINWGSDISLRRVE